VKKTYILALFLLAALLCSSTQLFARSSAAAYSQNYQIDQDLDLNAVASLFGDSRDLHDFERRLNDPYYQISNLDLNNDGYVDYMRVIETVEGNLHLIVIQAVIGHRRYQDIATIEVYRSYNQTYVQVVGNTYIYGPNYIIEPNYSYTPQIFSMFWKPRYYHAYRSSYRWRHYPSYYRPWRPVPVPHYHRRIRKHISHRNNYSYTNLRRAKYSRRVHNRVKRNDYARRYPKRSYNRRTNYQRSVKKRSQYRSNSRSEIKTRTHSGSRSRSEVKKRSHYRKDAKKSVRPNNRHWKRERIQQKSLSSERR
jgi:hypothetical protein